ncbi:von Willebrand factor type A domain-domain-containing protein [Clohesyomyces aquaticus]|uniref:von Willebrand factor type A domain-domain-containing protein n=1 Tax=Clohesyomyces aquaticus TaxID=1231657 RepID=A0A1Y1ZDT1_9PLEO|nr:von Willebrand factor type A domain-domain-containing protein [Clohesyomyces aquaticus]
MSTFYRRHPHIFCGLYYTLPDYYCSHLEKFYLPQVSLKAHSTILSTTSRTVLTQTFVNPSDTKGIREARYTFPLYDGVSVVGFTCHVGDRVIIGEVKEKEKAKQVFKEAVARGETAALLDQLPDASDVFTTTIGNIPPGADVVVKITYLGELKHDMEVDGIRFTIPTIICPRYGKYPLGLTSNSNAKGTGIEITVDAEMTEGSFIQQIRSPSHPISISMGTTSASPLATPTMAKASATLSLNSAQLDTDFILQIIAKDTGVPKAVLETHPTLPNHRALMATLVPKFSLPGEKPEVVFVVDRSGSMANTRIKLVIQALQVFLKSLPVGVKFNICSFGSTFSFLWPKSATYSQQTLDEAVAHVSSMTANFGGTEMYNPLKATIEQRYKDIPLEVMLLTDGEIWDQERLFGYLNTEIGEKKQPIRVFTLGIGNGVSHALIEGVAKAGNGFAQTVGEGEKMDSKVVRMLKGALSPHVNDYTLEVKYSSEKGPATTVQEEDDDFEIIEKVADSLTVDLTLDEKKEEKEKPVRGLQSKTMRTFFADYHQKKTISLFDPTADPDKEAPPPYDESGEARYSHLPKIALPKIIQAPQNIPSLFAFNRTTVYLLLGPDAPQKTPKSVLLKGTSHHGPLELEIPIQILDIPGETVHQLAAKKAISELEQGRGWLPKSKDSTGQLLKEKFESRFSDMVEREAVRLGVQFQVGGKWCSFVAVESNAANREKHDKGGYEVLDDGVPVSGPGSQGVNLSADSSNTRSKGLFGMFGGGSRGGRGGSRNSSAPPPLRTRSARTSGPQTTAVPPSQESYDPAHYASLDPSHSIGLSAGYSPSSPGYTPTSPPRAAAYPGSPPAFSNSYAAASYGPPSNPFPTRLSGVLASTERGERLDSLASRSNDLSINAEAFRSAKSAKKSSGLFGGLFGSSTPASAPSMAFGSPPAQMQPQPTGFQQQQQQAQIQQPQPAPRGSAFGSPFGSAAQAPPPPAHRMVSGSKAKYQFEADDEDEEWENGDEAQNISAVVSRLRHSAQLTAGEIDQQNMTMDRITAKSESVDAGIGMNRARLSRIGGPAPSAEKEAEKKKKAKSPGSPPKIARNSLASAPANMSGFIGMGGPGAPAPEPAPPAPPLPPKSPTDTLHTLISLQTFSGSFSPSPSLLSLLSLTPEVFKTQISVLGLSEEQLATALAVVYFENKLAEFQGSWELVVEKARGWLEGEGVGGDVLGKVVAVLG